MKSELVPHVDYHDQVIGVVERAVAYKEGLLCRAVHMLVRNRDGKYLIQRRQSHKPSWPDYFDLSVAETMKPDETYEQAAVRGLMEELSIEVSEEELTPIRSQYIGKYFYEDYKVFGFITLFLVTYDGDIHVDPEEVGWYGWIDEEQVTQKIREQSDICTPWFVQDWQYYIQHKDNL